MMQEPYELEMEIIPSPGTSVADAQEMQQKIELVKPFSSIVHIDVVDGKFASNTTLMDPTIFTPFTQDMTFEIHLMVENPLQYLDSWAAVGFRRFIGQVEMMSDIPGFVAKAQSLGDVGLALDIPTAIDAIVPYIEDLDFALVMTVKAGLSRQSFLPEMLKKVQSLREKAAFLPIEADGGMNETTIVEAKKAGATRFVTTGFVYDFQDSASQYARLQSLVAGQ